MQDSQKNKLSISDGMIIGFITLLGYLVALHYQMGYLGYFGIPEEFVHIELTNILVAIVAVAFSLFILLQLVDLISMFGLLKRDTARARARTLSVILLLAVGVIGFLSRPLSLEAWGVLIGVVALLLFVELVWPRILYRNKDEQEERLTEAEKNDEEARKNSVVDALIRRFGFLPFSLFVFAFILIQFSSLVGQNMASIKTVFPLIPAERPLVVLAERGDILLTMPFNTDTRTLEGSIIFVSLDELSQTKTAVAIEKTGRLLPMKR